MIVKVCGMREAENIRAVEALGVDWMGFIFWPRSSRYVSAPPAYLPTRCRRVGVFVDAAVGDVVQHAEDYGLNILQLHGHESPEYVQALKAHPLCAGGRVTIVKAISVSSRADVDTYRGYEGLVDYFLFDTKCKTVGGSGEHFDWSVLSAYDGPAPFLLSGGIGPDDAGRLRSFHHPRLAGIDLNSRFESAPAQKDVNKLKRFLYEQDQ